MALELIEIGDRDADRAAAACGEIRANGFQLRRVARHQVKAHARTRQAPRGRLRDRRGGSEDEHAVVAHRAVTRRQKLEENAGSMWRSKVFHSGNPARKVSGDMRASFAG